MNSYDLDTFLSEAKIAVIGLGYVGLPLAIEFAKKYPVLGFDIDEQRVEELRAGKDRTREADLNDLQQRISDGRLLFSSRIKELRFCNAYIITVPTPINQFKAPDLAPLLSASELVGSLLKPGDIVIYESTVYPGCTEEDCVPALERASDLTFNRDFFVGYSPERINPGDKVRRLTNIVKVTSGSTPKVADLVDELYRSIIEAGTHKAPSIKVAEAAKAIENAQRDLNISFVNELALIFDKMAIDTRDVLDAAATKWNFLKYTPGLVGGHCIGVDPYYLVHKAQSLGYHPQVILSGRQVNDGMGTFVANKVVKLLIEKDHKIKGSKVLIMGFTFKENCPDVRNTRVVDIYHEFVQFGLAVDVYDPWANAEEVVQEYGIEIHNSVADHTVYAAVVIAVAHQAFLQFDFQAIKQRNGVIFDAKGMLERSLVDARL